MNWKVEVSKDGVHWEDRGTFEADRPFLAIDKYKRTREPDTWDAKLAYEENMKTPYYRVSGEGGCGFTFHVQLLLSKKVKRGGSRRG